MPGIGDAWRAAASASRASGSGKHAVCVVTACRSFIPAKPALRGSTPSARAMARTASGVVSPRLRKVTKRCSPRAARRVRGELLDDEVLRGAADHRLGKRGRLGARSGRRHTDGIRRRLPTPRVRLAARDLPSRSAAPLWMVRSGFLPSRSLDAQAAPSPRPGAPLPARRVPRWPASPGATRPRPRGGAARRDGLDPRQVLHRQVRGEHGRAARQGARRGRTRRSSPVDGLKVKAVSKRGVKPQGHISRNEAEVGVRERGQAPLHRRRVAPGLQGQAPDAVPVRRRAHRTGRCNDTGVSSFNHYYGSGGDRAAAGDLHLRQHERPAPQPDPGLAGADGLVPKLQERRSASTTWSATSTSGRRAKSGTFRGGYYLDTHINGDGCDYRTTAHAPTYHDYSTGFRCCK